MKFSSKGFFSRCNKIRRKLRIWSNLLKKSIMENFIFCAVRSIFSIICYLLKGLESSITISIGKKLIQTWFIFKISKCVFQKRYSLEHLFTSVFGFKEHPLFISLI